MVIIFFLRAVFSKVIIASLHGIEKEQCSYSSPCDFSAAQVKISKYDVLFILDNYTDSPYELKTLQNIFQYALDNKCYIIGQNMTVNGSLLEHSQFPFIINNRAEECQITGFFFTEFHFSILCFRGVKKVFINECSFYNNTITSQIGLLIISFSTCKFLNCNFYHNSINKTSMISILSSFCIIELCNISYNNVFHFTHQGLILSSNSNCDLVNVSLDSNKIKHSAPLFQFEWRSYIVFYNSTFINNYFYNKYTQEHKSLIECDGICEISMYESMVINNNVSIIVTTTENSIVIMNSINISSNRADNFSLFVIPGGTLNISMISIIEKNSFLTFVDFHNLKSEINLDHVHFNLNNSTDSFFKMRDDSNFSLRYSSFFDNHCQNRIIDGYDINLYSFNNGFVRNIGQPIYCQNCSVNIFSDIYASNTEIPINITAKNSSTTIIFGSYFSSNLINNLNEIILKGSSLLLMLRFNYSYMKLPSTCYFCYYNQRKSGVFTLWSVLFTYSFAIFLITLLVSYFKSIIAKIIFNKNKKNQ